MQDLASIVLAFLPIIAVLIFANLGQGQRERGESGVVPAALAYGLMVALYGAGIAIGLSLHLFDFLMERHPSLLADFMGDAGGSMVENASLLAVGVWLPSLLGLVLLLKPVRTLLSRVIPIDPESPVDAVALSFTMLIVINLMVTLGIGLGNLASLVEEEGSGAGDTMFMLWAQQLVMALTAAIGVGWLTRRTWSATLQRLGIVVPTGKQVLAGAGAGLGMVVVVLLLEYLASRIGLQPDPDVEQLTEQLLGVLFESPWGIVTLGLAAAIGEEPLFRGAAQPKLGLVLTALLFALVHSNYGITFSTAVVFLLGIVLGVLRMRANTTTAMITHAVYNISLGLLPYFILPYIEP